LAKLEITCRNAQSHRAIISSIKIASKKKMPPFLRKSELIYNLQFSSAEPITAKVVSSLSKAKIKLFDA
jgi:hypothetical protein